MKNKTYILSLSALLFCSTCLLTLGTPEIKTANATELTNNQINEIKEDLSELGEVYTEMELQRQSTEQTLAYLKEEQQRLENTLRFLVEHLDNKEVEIVDLNKTLSTLKNDLITTQEELESQEETFKTRLNSMYRDYLTNENLNLFNVILNSEGFMEFINTYSNYQKVMKRDSLVVETYMSLVSTIQTNQVETEELLIDLDKKVNDLTHIVTKIEQTIKDKALIEIKVNETLEVQTNAVNELSKEIDSKSKNLDLLVTQEKERIEKEQAELKEKRKKEEINKEVEQSAKVDNTPTIDNTNTVNNTNTTTTKFNFEGDSEFLKYQESINWSRRNLSVETLNEYYEIIAENSAKYGVPTALIKAIIQTESSFRKDTTYVNNNGTIDRGLMQMNSNTAPHVATNLGIEYSVGIEFVPEKNIQMGTYYFSQKHDNNNIHKGLTSYNRGTTGAKNFYNKNGTYESEYSKKVVGFMEVFKKEEQN